MLFIYGALHLQLAHETRDWLQAETNIFLLQAEQANFHYEKKLTKNIRPTDILQIYTSI